MLSTQVKDLLVSDSCSDSDNGASVASSLSSDNVDSSNTDRSSQSCGERGVNLLTESVARIGLDRKSITSTSSISSMSSLTSCSSSSVCLRQIEPPKPEVKEVCKVKKEETRPRGINLRLRNLLPILKGKLNRKSKQLTLRETEALLVAQINEAKPTDAEMYSYKDRFEIRDPKIERYATLPCPKIETDAALTEIESLCYIDEAASTTSASSSVFAAETSHSDESPRKNEDLGDPDGDPYNFLNEVNKKLLDFRQKAKKPAANQLDSVSTRIVDFFQHQHQHRKPHTRCRQRGRHRMYDDQTIAKIINRDTEYDFNDNNNEMDFIYKLNTLFSRPDTLALPFQQERARIRCFVHNDTSSIAHIKVCAPLASSEHMTPLSRSIDYLNRVNQSGNTNAQMPIKKYYRLSDLSAYTTAANQR